MNCCMNLKCNVTTTSDPKVGWPLKAGGFAVLCSSCGVRYENSTYCSTFHQEEDGWRECRFCKKRVHCGCSGSKTLLEILDFGGVGCADCVRQLAREAVPAVGIGTKRESEMFVDAGGSRKLLRMQKCRSSGQSSSSAQPAAAQDRGHRELLKYWPQITEHELEQISRDLESPIVPLFEKVLSVSDAGRIGRLVLPKACAEAYFPPINQPEGVSITIQDVKGVEWTFQFRFWPNNTSRMYVLEGITPCIQHMNLKAGDTVIFSRKDPGGQLVMGFRRSTSNIDAQIEPQRFIPPTIGGSPVETTHSCASDRVILRVTWEEAQELLRPPPMSSPIVVKIDNYEFEEYTEPPVFGKKTVFLVGPSGQQEQWTQCGSCNKWRKLPVHVLVPANWSCPDNEWDSASASCLAPDAITPQDQEALIQAHKDYLRITGGRTIAEDYEQSGLDVLATAAVLGDEAATTTKHPRHRQGCSCIVCIKPLSGKAKHTPDCICNACLAIKRRFKTFKGKKKRQSDRAVVQLASQGPQIQSPPPIIDLTEMEDADEETTLLHAGASGSRRPLIVSRVDTYRGGLDLNCHPGWEGDMLIEASTRTSMDPLMDSARHSQLTRPVVVDAGGSSSGREKKYVVDHQQEE